MSLKSAAPNRRGGVALALITLLLLVAGNVTVAAPAKTLDEVLAEAKRAQQEALKLQQQREQRFLTARDQQQALFDQLKADVDVLERKVNQLEMEANTKDAALTAKKQELSERLGAYGEMFALVRQVAGDAAKQLGDSLISGEMPGRDKGLQALADSRDLPEFSQVSGLWLALLQEMKAQSETSEFTAAVIMGDGKESPLPITRIGPFVAVQDGRYIEYVPERGKFRLLGRQPGGKFLDAARNLEQRENGEITAAAIDPSRGSILALLVQTPSLGERMHQGGLVGYIIMGLAIFGVLLALVRIFMLRRTAFKVERQKRLLDEPLQDNPLGRVLLSVTGQGANDTEVIERKLDESILKEMPALEWGLPLVKLLAAIAPLLGLLGTVVGMILTFQAISLFGSGDPKLMAGGISQALVTTVLGLVTAIPLLLLHSVANGTSRRVEQTLEEQAAALVAERIEGRCR